MPPVRLTLGRRSLPVEERPPEDTAEVCAPATPLYGDEEPEEAARFEEALRLARAPLEIGEALRHDPEPPGQG